jgi:hypothetical protein
MGNTVGLPACPRGNSMTILLNLTRFGGTQPIDITGSTFAFIANRELDQKTAPQVYIEWSTHVDAQNGKTKFTVSDAVTTGLDPGPYYWNITARNAAGEVKTYGAGTWPITPVPGTISAAYSLPNGG